MTEELFAKHSILGLQPQIINSNKSYNIVLIGSSSLSIEIIYQLTILSNLPEQNILNLYLIDYQAKKFYQKLKKLFSGIEKIPHINILTIELDVQGCKFYSSEIWRNENLTNIIITTEDELLNLEIALRLQGNIFSKTKVWFAKEEVNSYIFHEDIFPMIDKFKKRFTNLHYFSSLEDKELECIAKLINYLYRETKYNPHLLFTKENKNEAQKLWLDETSTDNKKISKMQSLHMNTKLLALGLKKQKSTKTPKELLKINKEIFEKKLGFREIDDKESQEYAQKFYDSENHFKSIHFPEKFESLFEKLIRSEQNKWNTYQYLNGGTYDKNRDDLLKKHDIYSLVYIPNILASVGIELIDSQKFSNIKKILNLLMNADKRI